MKNRILKIILKTSFIFSILFGVFYTEFPFGSNKIILLNKGNYYKVIYGESKLQELRQSYKNILNELLKGDHTKEKVNFDFVKYDFIVFKNSVRNKKEISIIFCSAGIITNVWSLKKNHNQKYLTLFTRGAVGITFIQLITYISILIINLFLLFKTRNNFIKFKSISQT